MKEETQILVVAKDMENQLLSGNYLLFKNGEDIDVAEIAGHSYIVLGLDELKELLENYSDDYASKSREIKSKKYELQNALGYDDNIDKEINAELSKLSQQSFEMIDKSRRLTHTKSELEERLKYFKD